MSSKITVNGGEIICTAPSVTAITQKGSPVGTYGTAKREVIVNGGKFKTTIVGSSNKPINFEPGTSGVTLKGLTGGYFSHNEKYWNMQLEDLVDDSCYVTNITSAEIDPEFNNGYHYRVDIDYAAKVSDGTNEWYFHYFKDAFAHALKKQNATITLLRNIDYDGEKLRYEGAVIPDNATCTLDLNGDTIRCTGADRLFQIDKSGATFTITDLSGTNKGRIECIQAAPTSEVFAISHHNGTLIVEGGEVYTKQTINNTARAIYAIGANAHAIIRGNAKVTGESTGTHWVQTLFADRGASIEVSGTPTITATATKARLAQVGASGDLSSDSTIMVISGGRFIANQELWQNQGLVSDTKARISVTGGVFDVYGAVAITAKAPSTEDRGVIKVTGGYFSESYQNNREAEINAVRSTASYKMTATTPVERAMYGEQIVWKMTDKTEIGDELDIVDVDNENHTITINVSNWSAWPYTITVNGTDYTYDQSSGSLAGDLTLTIPYTGNPGEEVEIAVADNTTTISQHTYIIPMEVTSATEVFEDKLMSIYVNGTTLTINGDVRTLNVYVGADAAIVIKDGKTLDADSLFLRTKATMSAELKRLGSGNVAGRTKVFYTRIVSDNMDYYQFGLPAGCTVHTEDVKLSNGDNSKYYTGSGWILREYNETSRAENGPDGPSGIGNWRSVQTNAYIAGGRGYNMYSALRCYREYYFPISLGDLDTKVPVAYTASGDEQNRGWNVLVSPLTETYTNTPVPEGIVIAWLSEGGTVQAQPTAIPPATAFVYQASSEGYLSFAGQTIVKNMPRRIKAEEEETRIQWVHLDIADANGVGDQTSVYSHPERYEETYQNGIDVLKYALTSSHATMYTLLPYGEMAFAGVADRVLEQGVPLTVYSPSAQELTISMRDNEWLDRLEYVYLIDNETGLRIDLFMQDYRFDAEAGTTEGRFLIQGVFKAPQGTTDIENGEVGDGEQVRKLLIRDKMYIIVNGRLYDATGKLVNK